MAVQTSISQRNNVDNDDDDDDEEIDETEGDLIENYFYLTKRCGLLRHSPTTSALDTLQHQQHLNSSIFPRQFSCETENHPLEFERSFHPPRSLSSSNNFNNNNNNYHAEYSAMSRVPPTIYYNGNDDDDSSFSLVKLFARMKTRLKHDRRYRPKSTHQLLHEEDSPEWYEFTKSIHRVFKKALLPDGGYDASARRNKTSYTRYDSQKKIRDYTPVLLKELEDEEEKIKFEIDDEFNTEGDEEFDQIIWEKFRKCSRGLDYRRCGVCKAVDRQQYQGQLVYVYGIANNILIDENLKASGLG
jgi:hypothetical protein